jgi:hypothetical protein
MPGFCQVMGKTCHAELFVSPRKLHHPGRRGTGCESHLSAQAVSREQPVPRLPGCEKPCKIFIFAGCFTKAKNCPAISNKWNYLENSMTFCYLKNLFIQIFIYF